jgi:hypothetical protein
MSIMNWPAGGLGFGRRKDMLKHELGQGDGNWGGNIDDDE